MANSTNSRVVLVGLVLCATVAIIALILGAIAMANTSSGSSQRSGSGGAAQGGSGGTVNIQVGGPAQKPRIYTISHGHDYHSNEFIDPQGKVQGFHMDYIDAVCKAAGIQCKKLWDPYSNCYQSKAGQHPYVGRGLSSKWYDACTGWVKTPARSQQLAFTDAYLKIAGAWFYTLPSSNFNQFDLSGITKPIGFIDGWYSDEKCLARITSIKGGKLPLSKIIHYTHTKDLQKAILDGTLAAGFAPQDDYTQAVKDGILKRYGQTGSGKEMSFQCTQDGLHNCMMARKDNVEFIKVWNAGFRKLVASGEFKALCEKSYKKYEAYGNHECVDV